MEVIFPVLCAQGLTIGEFFMMLLRNPTNFSQSAEEAVKWFIQSCTKENHLVDIIWVMYNHPWGASRSSKPSYYPLPPYSIPLDPNLPHDAQDTYGHLQQFFASEVFCCVNVEAECLCASKYLQTTDIKTARFSWDTILDFSVSTVQDIAMQTALVIWMFLTLIALGGDWVIV